MSNSAHHLLRTHEATLLRGPWFASLSEGARQSLISSSVVANVAPGNTFCEQGSVPEVWAGVLRGAVQFSVSDANANVTTLDLLGPGEWFGDVSLLQGTPLAHSVEALVPSTLLLMRGSVLRKLLYTDCELPLALARLNWHRAQRLAEQMQVRAHPSLIQRLRAQLLILARDFGGAPSVDGHISLGLPLTQTQLAQLTHACRQRVNEALGELRSTGEVRYSGSLLEVAPSKRGCDFVPAVKNQPSDLLNPPNRFRERLPNCDDGRTAMRARNA